MDALSKNHLVALELVQRRFSKRVRGLHNFSYTDRLKFLNIPSLWWRYTRGSLITTFKIIIENFGGDSTSSLFQLSNTNFTRGHSYKLARPHLHHVRATNFFTYRVIETWNSLPSEVINSNSVNQFKNNLDKHVADNTNWKFTFYE